MSVILKRLRNSGACAGKRPSVLHFKAAVAAVRGKKGSAAVLLCMILISVVSALSVIYESATGHAVENMADASLDNTGRVLLSCYDRELQERYGIFGLEMDEAKVEKNAEKILEKTFESASLKKAEIESVEAECAAYSLVEPQNLKAQIVSMMKYGAAKEAISVLTEAVEAIGSGTKKKSNLKKDIAEQEADMDKAEELQKAKEAEDDDDSDDEDKVDFDSIRKLHNKLKDKTEDAKTKGTGTTENAVLRSGRIINSLPSVTHKADSNTAFDGTGTFGFFTDTKEGLVSVYDNFTISHYATEYFTNHISEEKTGFFQNEVEYILFGKMSDKSNYNFTYASIFAIRETLNILYICTDSSKMRVISSIAEAGPWGTLTALLIVLAWSSIESYNDMLNLNEGNAVPLLKDDSTWMTSIDNVLEDSAGDGYLKIESNSIMTYEYYLKILMMTQDQETKLYRIMDLIQINMKGSVREEFLMADHFSGFTLNVSVKKNSVSPYMSDRVFDLTQAHKYVTDDESAFFE